MLKHGEIFTHKKHKVVLLLDRVVLSIDDKNDDEFVFTTIKDNKINQVLYFVISSSSYIKFKEQYPKAMLAGFWHSLFVNNKINLSASIDHYLIADELVYQLHIDGGELSTSFVIAEAEDEGVISNIDTDLSKFELLISPADKVKKQRLRRKIKLSVSGLFWLLIVIGLYAYNIQKNAKASTEEQQIASIKQQISLQDHQIIKQEKSIFKLNKTIKKSIDSLLFLRFKSVGLAGEVDLARAIEVKSNSDIAFLEAFTKEYKQYTLTRHAEALPSLRFNHE